MHGYQSDKKQLQKRLARIEGQVRGISKMVDEDRYCIDILDQVSAVTKALKAVSVLLVNDHLGHCVREAIETKKDHGQAKLDEATAAIERLVRS